MPSIKLVQPQDMGPRDWGVETLIVQTEQYIGKRLEMRAGTAGGLQYHRHKDEAFLLVSGKALVTSDNGDGALTHLFLTPGQMVHVPPGTPHRVTALSACVFYEWSTPHFNDRVRVEADYGETVTGGLQTSADATGTL